VTSVAFADQNEHQHRREYVFPDGVVLGDAIAAIQAAGLAESYVTSHQICVRYALDVCVRCASQFSSGSLRTPLTAYGIMSSWGSICSVCELQFLSMGRSKRVR
jgi:hypothetical protein